MCISFGGWVRDVIRHDSFSLPNADVALISFKTIINVQDPQLKEHSQDMSNPLVKFPP